MDKEQEFIKQMESLQVPDVDPAGHQQMVKIAIMNAGRSATLGVWLIIVPSYFLLCVCMYYYFHVHMSWFGAMFALMVRIDHNPYIDFLAPILLFVLPIICIIINALAIIHVQVQKAGVHQTRVKEVAITVKLKLWNIVLILLSLLIIGIFISFSMVTSISISN